MLGLIQPPSCAAVVGRDLQLLDQLAGSVLHLLPDVDHAFIVEHGSGLERLERKRTLGLPAFAQPLGDLVLGLQLHVEPGIRARRVGQGTLAVDPFGARQSDSSPSQGHGPPVRACKDACRGACTASAPPAHKGCITDAKRWLRGGAVVTTRGCDQI